MLSTTSVPTQSDNYVWLPTLHGSCKRPKFVTCNSEYARHVYVYKIKVKTKANNDVGVLKSTLAVQPSY